MLQGFLFPVFPWLEFVVLVPLFSSSCFVSVHSSEWLHIESTSRVLIVSVHRSSWQCEFSPDLCRRVCLTPVALLCSVSPVQAYLCLLRYLCFSPIWCICLNKWHTIFIWLWSAYGSSHKIIHTICLRIVAPNSSWGVCKPWDQLSVNFLSLCLFLNQILSQPSIHVFLLEDQTLTVSHWVTYKSVTQIKQTFFLQSQGVSRFYQGSFTWYLWSCSRNSKRGRSCSGLVAGGLPWLEKKKVLSYHCWQLHGEFWDQKPIVYVQCTNSEFLMWFLNPTRWKMGILKFFST